MVDIWDVVIAFGAAAVTVGATIWWDARARRRDRLEAAMLELTSAANAWIRHFRALDEDAAPVDGCVSRNRLLQSDFEASAQTVQSLAKRKVLRTSPRAAAPTRHRLASALEPLLDQVAVRSAVPTDDGTLAMEALEHPDEWLVPLVANLIAVRNVVRDWLRDPWSIDADSGDRYLAAAEKYVEHVFDEMD